MRKVGFWLARAVWRLAFVTMIALVLAGCGPFGGSSASVQSVSNTTALAATQTSTPVPIVPTRLPPTPTPPPPVAITITSPDPGTPIGSPVVITGQIDRLPASGVLSYRFTGGAGQPLGAATFPVSGTPGQPGSFNASLEFPLPREGGPVHLDVFEAGQASPFAGRDLVVEAQYQEIRIDTPPQGQVVGSPVVLTGQTKRAPYGDTLNYQVFNSASQEIGRGAFPVGRRSRRATQL